MKRAIILIISFLITKHLLSQDLHLYGGKSHNTYLGCLNCSKLDNNSIWNRFGTYGSRYNSNSIWSKYGTYGGKYEEYSPFNNNALYPPVIVDKEGDFYGYLTINKSKDKRADFLLALIIYENYEEIRDDISEWYSKIFDGEIKSGTQSNTRRRYESPDPDFVQDFLYEPNWELAYKVLKHKDQQYLRKTEKGQIEKEKELWDSKNNSRDKQEEKQNYKSFDAKKNITIGVRIGCIFNEFNQPSLLGGIFLEGSRSVKFSAEAEVLYFEPKHQWTEMDYESNSEKTKIYKTKIVQVNLNLKNRIIKRFDILYGLGASFDVHDQQTIFLDLNMGLKYYITYKTPIEIRYNRNIADISSISYGNDFQSHFIFSLAYVF